MRKWLPLALFAITLIVSWALSPWWNPWEYSLSALGSVSNGLGGAVYDGGLALTSWSISQVNVKSYQSVIEAIAALVALVAAVNIDFGAFHVIIASSLFVLLYLYILMHSDLLAYLGSVLSIGLWTSHWLLGVPPGIALPELSVIALAFFYLLGDSG